jgi:hypothetical protein
MTSLADNVETFKQCDLELSNWGAWSSGPLVKLGYPASSIFKHMGKRLAGRSTNENTAMYTDGIVAKMGLSQKVILKAWYIGELDYIQLVARLKITRQTAERRLSMAQQVYWDMARV